MSKAKKDKTINIFSVLQTVEDIRKKQYERAKLSEIKRIKELIDLNRDIPSLRRALKDANEDDPEDKFELEKDYEIVELEDEINNAKKELVESDVYGRSFGIRKTRPTPAYIYFYRDMHQKIKDDNPEMDDRDIAKEIARMWREDYHDEDRRKRWIELNRKDKERYDQHDLNFKREWKKRLESILEDDIRPMHTEAIDAYKNAYNAKKNLLERATALATISNPDPLKKGIRVSRTDGSNRLPPLPTDVLEKIIMFTDPITPPETRYSWIQNPANYPEFKEVNEKIKEVFKFKHSRGKTKGKKLKSKAKSKAKSKKM